MPTHHALAQEADAMKRYAITLTRDVHTADDLVQDCMERALRKWTMRRAGVPLRAWLFTMMRNLHVDGWRQAKRRQTESLETMTSPPAIPPTQENHVELNRLLARVMSLPDDQRVALILVSVEGFTYREAAQTLGVPEGTILSRVSRARAALRGATAETAPRLRSVT